MNKKPDLIKEWLLFADNDYGYALLGLENNSYFGLAGASFQQAAEKYLKAFILTHDLEMKYIHNLLELLKICESKDKNIMILKDDCSFLNQFYIQARYPAGIDSFSYDKDDVVKAKKCCEQIQQWIKNSLSDFI
ncbi:MAG: HEPN domain-containing protein [Spirochaetia bacterium]|nr:HEPN domain-containing protein [Spirochaetia bacterium]